MKNKILILSISLIVCCCKQNTVKSNENANDILVASNVKNISQVNNQWKGVYHFEASNRDDSKTSFDIVIKSLNDLSICINEDGTKSSYSHIKSENISDEKIKIIYDSSLEGEMGTIYIEKSDNGYLISGNPIYFINPGNNEMPLEKIK
ncbi:hypothetical protein GCM10023210_03380 [Chryseobacterium ginsengisoli]|uniref:Lipocalin-like domain-containing protein n=1 Tax=Chryseobacterium ginsengisoli TaxID=363853 RepID=A0ABP9LRM6_9FLAO